MSSGGNSGESEAAGRGPASAALSSALVDAHVHYHDCFDQAAFFDQAFANFRREAVALGLPAGWIGCLLLTESAGDDFFARFKQSGSAGTSRWRFAGTGEDSTLRATCDGAAMLLVRGRQVVTAERLEVLALGAADAFAEGRPVAETIAAVAAAGALPVLPWGFGKWTGRRGDIARRLAEDVAGVPRLFFGDSAGRPSVGPRPRLLGLAERCGRVVLPGTDPLPLAGDVGKAGRFGFVAEAALDPDRPFASLARWLTARRTSPPAYGRLERPATFVQRQAAMQLRKRRRRD